MGSQIQNRGCLQKYRTAGGTLDQGNYQRKGGEVPNGQIREGRQKGQEEEDVLTSDGDGDRCRWRRRCWRPTLAATASAEEALLTSGEKDRRYGEEIETEAMREGERAGDLNPYRFSLITNLRMKIIG